MNDRPMRPNRPDDDRGGNRPSFNRPSFNRPSGGGGGGGLGGFGGRPRKPIRQYPLLLGEPSPSLAKINRASIEELERRIGKLQEEGVHIIKRIEALSKLTPPDEAKIKTLKDQLRRLRLLESKAKERMEEKRVRRQEWEQRQGQNPQGGGGYRGQGGQGGGGGRPQGPRPPRQP